MLSDNNNKKKIQIISTIGILKYLTMLQYKLICRCIDQYTGTCQHVHKHCILKKWSNTNCNQELYYQRWKCSPMNKKTPFPHSVPGYLHFLTVGQCLPYFISKYFAKKQERKSTVQRITFTAGDIYLYIF